ncbi:MAG: efflux RND transporter permease subunit, partial [Granulosicoccus sp.]|nr:efflux RND transporter permease subunit [Granulosicoccus sp.]
MKALINAAFLRSRTVLLCLAFLLVAGVISYITIPKESTPDITIPIIYVSLGHEGISPQDAERLLVKPMETELQGLTGLKEMRSTSSEGHASIILEFDAGFDSEFALTDVREKVDRAKNKLPEATDEPVVTEINLALFPILTISLSGPVPERALLEVAKNLQDQLESLPEVFEAEIAGERQEVLEIIVEPTVMETYGFSFESLFSLIQRNNLLVAAGAIDTGAGRMVLKVPGVIENLDDILRLPVKVDGDTVVTFGDIGTVRRTYKDPQGFARLDGQPTLALEISKRIGANLIKTVESVRATVAAEQKRWPPNIKVNFLQDQSKQTRTMLTDLQNNVLTGVILVMIVVMAALGVRSALLVGLAIPGSFL